jgi:hypothetical protein
MHRSASHLVCVHHFLLYFIVEVQVLLLLLDQCPNFGIAPFIE